MENETEYFLSQDGLRLYYRLWAAENPKQLLCIVHGFGEHSGRYQHVAHYFNNLGITVFAMDLRGHGISQGKKGHARNLDIMLSDIEELLKTARAENTDLPMFLMGHSMGGNLVANYMIKMNTNELKGFMLSSPWFKLAFEPPKWKVSLANTISKIIPSLAQKADLVTAHLSRDPEVVKAYENDPLVHGTMTARLFVECLNGGEQALQRASEIKKPGLVIHGSEDKVINPTASKAFADKNDQIKFVSMEGSYHESLNDLDKEQVMKIMADWMLA